MSSYIDCTTTQSTFGQLARQVIVQHDNVTAIKAYFYDVSTEPLTGCDLTGWLAFFKSLLYDNNGQVGIRCQAFDTDLFTYTSCENCSDSVESLFKRVLVKDNTSLVYLKVVNLSFTGDVYTTCENTDEPWQSLFRKIIYTDENNNLFVNIANTSEHTDLLFECTSTNSLIDVFKQCVITDGTEYALMLNTD